MSPKNRPSRSPFAFLPLAAVLCATALAAGCGYDLVGRGVNIPTDVRAVYVAPFVNSTPRSQVEQFITRAVADELVTRQRFSVVRSRAEADAVLEGEVVAFAVTPVAFDAQGRANEYEISLTSRVVFSRTGSDEVLWANDRYLFRENYEVEVSEAEYFDREDIALDDAAQRFAETMVSDLLEGF